jgi:UDP-N-acetylglucosamine--N-acetylmuramyl-(pentapeptide) pyrophosphoryl-undecaprenol N-acetylglucosamine transferase
MAEAKAHRVLIAGGGTGGHLFPGLAIAEAFLARRPGTEVRFVGGHYGLEGRVVPARGFRLHRIPVRGLYGVSLPRRLWALALLPFALLRCFLILLAFRPHIVIGVGGYASGPMLAAALLTRRLTVLQEQNAYPGLTNRWLGRFVRLAFVPFEGLERFFPRRVVVGNPVRAAILALREEAPAERSVPLLFVFGGSQGARRINQAVCEALPRLEAWGRPLEILHQTGPHDHGLVSAAYAATGLRHEVAPFIEDMADAFRRARLIVSRAGASAVTEIIAARRAALLIPIPGTSGEHQLKNAERLAEAGAGELLEQADLSGETLAARLTALLDDPPRLAAMETATDTLFAGDAAARIVEECERLMR